MLTGIRIRRTLVAAMFRKVERLSMKSLSETSSGKLVSIISSDLFQVERGLAFTPLVLASPLVNVLSFGIVGFVYSWEYAGIIFLVWVVTVLMQIGTGACGMKQKRAEAMYTDQRLGYVNDMVVGARTIKCYGWESNYL